MVSEARPTAGIAPHDVAAPGPCASGRGASSRQPRSPLRWDIAACVLLGLASFLIYNANLRSIPAVDTYAARYLPFSIWRNHTVVLDPIADTVAQGRKISTSDGQADAAWWIRKGREDHLISFYPIVVPLIVAPLYLPAVAYLEAHGWDPLLLDHVARIMEKLCASLIAAASVMLLYLLMRRRSEPKTAALLALAFALGTTTWVISSQALWMHGLGELLIVATLLLLTGPCSALRAVTAGFLCALIACNRQPDVVLAAGLGLYGLWWAGRMIPMFVAAAALPVGLVLAYNLKLIGHIIGAYGLVSQARLAAFLSDDVLAGVAGLLFSPTHGLFVFSPFLLFVPCCLSLVLRDRSARGLTAVIGCAAVLQLMLYGFGDWRQGVSWGPRWLTDMLPILFWMLPPILAALSTAGRVAFGFACCVAIAIEVVGAFWYTGVSDMAVFAAEGPDRMRAGWDIRNAPFIAELRHPRAPADLLVDLRGNIDLVMQRDAASDKAGRQVEIHGWALTNSRSPADVAVTVDGRLTAGTSDFFERPDVVRALGETNPSGWRLAFPADHLAPGKHVVAALVRAHEGGEPRFLKERTFTLTSENEADRRDRELANAARRAAEVLAERQQGPGYWLTAFTDTARFERSRQELNTFVNAVMIDVAGPVAEAAGIAPVLGRARDFLANQIEAGGLVRYHGRPDAPTIGSLGCAITPDADDTALVWRVAPIERPDLRSMALAMLGRFRTADGLYRTWLAPKERYECIDPGKDPNPADIAIQIHVLMLLAQADPPAARALCEALQKRSADEDIWVYYRNTPPILILRLTDLQKVGCPLQLPQRLLQTTVPGQEVWIEAIQHLQRIEGADGSAAARSETADLLHKLADDDFSLLARVPPLLYHNDLTASVRRFYWSAEVGYALWLRLYFENELARPACRGRDAKQECVEK
jgi:hypothetical protein